MSVKDKWKDTGKGLGKSFAGLGKSIVKSVKVGAERILDEEPKDENGNTVKTDLRESWSEVGHNFGNTGKSLGKAVSGTARKVADKIDPEDENATESDGLTVEEQPEDAGSSDASDNAGE
jgi:hypothetical protein